MQATPARPRRSLLLFLLFPFWIDTLEPFMFSLALGSAIASSMGGTPNVVTTMIAVLGYAIAVGTRWQHRRLTYRDDGSSLLGNRGSATESPR